MVLLPRSAMVDGSILKIMLVRCSKVRQLILNRGVVCCNSVRLTPIVADCLVFGHSTSVNAEVYDVWVPRHLSTVRRLNIVLRLLLKSRW